MVLAKICGIKNATDAAGSLAAGADMLGFHVELEGGRSPLSAEEAAQMIAGLPPGVASVVVTSLAEPDKLIALARATGATTLQLYGDATPEGILEVKAALPSLTVWKVLNVAGESSIEKAKEYEKAADAIALDTLNKKTGARGGSGKAHDWSISKRIVESISIPVVLAGGLDPENVVEAVRKVLPYAVDVNSGVSNPDGSKDLAKVELFVTRAKSI